VSCTEPYEWKDPTEGEWEFNGATKTLAGGKQFLVVAYDFGIKHNILRRLASFGCKIVVVPVRRGGGAGHGMVASRRIAARRGSEGPGVAARGGAWQERLRNLQQTRVTTLAEQTHSHTDTRAHAHHAPPPRPRTRPTR
jgi:carbamoylphosphate synthase small subunit